MFSPSAKIVILSARPSASVSSRILTRSRPAPAGLRGYSMLSVIQIRPRSSKDIAMGLTMSGSLATSSTVKPSGTVILLPRSDDFGPGGENVCRHQKGDEHTGKRLEQDSHHVALI